MSATIEQRVVEMQFDNRNFEKNVQTSLSTIEKLKQKLNLSGASKGLEEINKAANRTDLSGVSTAVETINAKFSALQIVGATALANITNSAINAGKRITKALTIDPIKTGFQEYETQINAVQTILANTESKGTTLKDVNKALDELNKYADMTIYNFTEMTRNIGTFTAAGVDLDTSVASIKGIANLAAVSGSTSQQASTAMYQLSQALAAGKVSLMDWNSVVNAGMGGQVFQDALKRTSEALGTGAKDAIKKYGSFRESLTKGEWLTTEVLTKTLEQFTMHAEKGTKQWEEYKKSLKGEGYTDKQAEEILKMANTATNAATKVKTFTQLWDVLKEAAQSGWTQTWEILVGDFEEAKSLLTSISDALTGFLNNMSNARNDLLQTWKDMGGRNDMIDSFKNVFKVLIDIAKPIKEAFSEIFPPTTAKQLKKFSEGFKALTESFKISDETADKIKRTFKGLFSVIDIFRKMLGLAAGAVGGLFTSGLVSGVLDVILSVTAGVGDMITAINNGTDLSAFGNIFKGIADVIAGAIDGVTNFSDSLSGVGESVSKVVGKIFGAFKTAFTWITDNVSIGEVFAGLMGGGIFMAAKKLAGMFDSFGGLAEKGLLGIIFGGGGDDSGGQVTKFREVLGSVNESLGAFTNGIKVGSMVAIAGAIAILAGALSSISEVNVGDVTKSLIAIGVMFKMLTTSFSSITGALTGFTGTGIVKSGISMMLMAKAIDILADAVKELSGLSIGDIVKGLVGIGGAMGTLVAGLKLLNGVKIRAGAIIAIGVLASAIKSVGESLVELGKMTWDEIGRGLTAMAGALTEFLLVLKVFDKISGFKSLAGSVSMLIAVQALDEIAAGLSDLGVLSWGEIGRGLTAMGGSLAIMGTIVGVLGKLTGFSGILGSLAIVETSKSLGDIAGALSELSLLSWSEIGRGLAAMGGALSVIGIVTGSLGKLAGFSGLLGAATLVVSVKSLGDLADAFSKFAEYSWDEIKTGLTAMGGALAEVAVVTGALGALAGFSGILGAGALLLAVQGLGDIADALKKFGSMTWDEIARGLTGMGGALTELAVISGLLGTLGGFGALIGSGSLLIATKGLGDIADALKKFGDMSWSEIGKGLTAMGAALGEIALGGLLNTLSIIGSVSIKNIAEPLGVLADSVKKWSGVEVPAKLGLNLMLLADGVTAFTFGGFGASAISEVAGPLGTMADSVKKWTGVTVPENLGENLKTLASGIKAFTFGGLGASAISEVAGPLGTLSDSVRKWLTVKVPEDLGDKLKTLATGVKKFTFGELGASAISEVAEPLGTLATSVSKWSKTTIPSDLGDKLKKLSDGVKTFTGGWTVAKGIKNAETVAEAAVKLSGVNFESVKAGLDKFAGSMKKLGDSSGSISGLGNKISKNIIKPITELEPKVKNAGSKIADALSSGLNSNGDIKTAANKLVNGALKTIGSKTSNFENIGTKLSSSLAKGVKSKEDTIKKYCVAGLKSGLTSVKEYRDDFYDAGAYVAAGMASGMKSKNTEIQNAANSMAAAAEAAVRAKLKINSPSKVFMAIAKSIPEGFAKGIGKFGNNIKNSTVAMSETAIGTAVKMFSGLAAMLETDVNTQPTIRPVVDLSDVKTGVGAIEGMFGFGPTVGVTSNLGAISSMMNSRNQNGSNADVVSAIDKLRGELGNVGGDSIVINGVTYNDDSGISDAAKALVRAITMEGRV